MDHAYIEDHQIVDRYLMERLSAAEATRFEAHYLDCQQCLDQLTAAETFQENFRHSAAHDAARLTGAKLGALVWLARLGRRPQIALLTGALFVAILMPAGFAQRWVQEKQAREALVARLEQAHQPQVNTLVFPLRRERGIDADVPPSRQIQLRPSPEWIVLSLESDLSAAPAQRYLLTLVNHLGQEIWQTDQLQPDALGALQLSLHSSWLSPGTYRIRVGAVAPENSPHPIQGDDRSFAFRVLAEP